MHKKQYTQIVNFSSPALLRKLFQFVRRFIIVKRLIILYFVIKNNIKIYICYLKRRVLQQEPLYYSHVIHHTISFLINSIFSYKFRNRAPDIYKNNTMYIAPFSFCYTYSFLSIFYIVMTHIRSRFWAFHCTFTEEIFNGKLHFLCSVFSISSYQSCLKSSLLKFQI